MGKSAVADALAPVLNAIIFDAEAVGNAVRDNYPDMPFGPVFEDYSLWQEFCFRLLRDLHDTYHRDVLIPMTLLREASRREILDCLADAGIDVRLVVLTASHQTIHDRILARGEEEDCWCMQQIDMARKATAALKGALLVDTEGRTIAEIAHTIRNYLYP